MPTRWLRFSARRAMGDHRRVRLRAGFAVAAILSLACGTLTLLAGCDSRGASIDEKPAPAVRGEGPQPAGQAPERNRPDQAGGGENVQPIDLGVDPQALRAFRRKRGDRSPGGPAQGDGPAAADDSIFVRPPTIRPSPNTDAPLAASVRFITREPVVARLEVDDGEQQWSVEFGRRARTEHDLVLLGLRPGRRHVVRVIAERREGVETSEPLQVTTPPLPDDFPPLETTVTTAERMEPGVTLFGVNRWVNDAADLRYGYLVAVDGQGAVVWYHRLGHPVADLRRVSSGRLLYNHGSNWYLYESDMLGNVTARWHAANLAESPPADSTPVAADTFHHETLEMPSGNLVSLSTELVHLDHYPISEVQPSPAMAEADVVADVIVEFSRDGTVRRKWRMLDLLDRRRIGYGSLTGFWDTRAYKSVGRGTRDWSHANGLYYDEKDESFLVSLRHQDAVVKFDPRDMAVRWILGNHYDWRRKWRKHLLKPVGELRWPYHQHAPQITPAGTLLLYDNGNYRAKPYHQKTPAWKNFSRVVEFAIDEEQMTVRQVWQYRGRAGQRFYCPFFCEADWLPQTGNILITDGGHVEHSDGTPSDDVPADYQWARILEVTHSTPAEKLFELLIDAGPESDTGYSVYRAERLPSLYGKAANASVSDRNRVRSRPRGSRDSPGGSL